MMHFMISLLYSILSNDTFYQFSGEYWCFALLNMSFDFFWCSSLTLHLFSCNAFIWWQFFIESPKVLVFFFQELPWAYSPPPPCVWKCLTCDPIPPVGVGLLLFSPQPHLGISAHFPAFSILGDSIREQFLKANEGKNPRWCFRLWPGFVRLWRGFQKTKIKGIWAIRELCSPAPLWFSCSFPKAHGRMARGDCPWNVFAEVSLS